jgi:hypothetical protein
MARTLPLGFTTVIAAVALAVGTSGASGGPLWTEPDDTVTSAACCGDLGGPYSLGSADIQNRGGRPLMIRSVVLVWDRRPGYADPRQFAQFLLGGDKHGDYGDGYEWPPPREVVGKRRYIPGAQLAPGETGQVIVGIRLPHKRTMHMKAIVVHYTVGGRSFALRTRSDNWYCYTSQAECDQLSGAPSLSRPSG